MSFRLRCSKPFAVSDFMPKGCFDVEFEAHATAVAMAIEAMPEDDTPVQVIDVTTGDVVWDSAEEEFEPDWWEAT